jgi:hypothetical protein
MFQHPNIREVLGQINYYELIPHLQKMYGDYLSFVCRKPNEHLYQASKYLHIYNFHKML